jgi:hypothetical protein
VANVIYAEYIEHDRVLPIQIFEHLGRQTGWDSQVDEKVANLARAERIAPQPSVICLWRNSGMARMDEWEPALRSEAALRDPAAQALRLSVHFTRSGLYDEIIGGPPLGKGLHFIEFFSAGEEVSDAEVREHFLNRARHYPDGHLDFVLRRVVLLGPEPGALAIWTFANYAAVEPIARERHNGKALRPTAAGLYFNFEDARI